MKKRIFLFLIALVCLVSPAARAENGFDRYYEKVSDKFNFGAVNFMAGWSEFVTEPVGHAETQKGLWNRAGHGMAGFAEGLMNGILNTTGGAVNLVTSPIPQFRIPLPEGGVNLQKMGG